MFYIQKQHTVLSDPLNSRLTDAEGKMRIAHRQDDGDGEMLREVQRF